MESLFAPWRLEFIIGPREEGCIFCKKPAARRRLRENLILHVGRKAFVIMNRYPYTSGHLLVCPLRHTSDFASLTAAENREISALLQRSLEVLSAVYRPEGFNLGLNLGLAGGAGIRDHIHWHVVPRWYGDTNFLPVLADARSVPELLIQAYDRLKPGFDALRAATARPRRKGGRGR